DAAYYVVPDGEAGEDVFVVLREAFARSKRIALSRIVIARRERAVAIRPMGRGLVAHTLHEARDVYDAHSQFAEIPGAAPDSGMVKLAMQLIERQSARFVPADIEDRYEERLRNLIESTLKGEGIAPEPEPEETRGKVIDLMQALKESLQAMTEKSAPRPASRTQSRTKAKARPARRSPARRAG
ncbi:MAG TPA: Ku protein, partial [Acetobacteraceae bacterium]|nr:Ku protein [Acetobacteraceae bacterium]